LGADRETANSEIMKKLLITAAGLMFCAGLVANAASTANATSASPEATTKLTAEQKKARKELVGKYDTDKNGKLSAEEKAKLTAEDAKKLADSNPAKAAKLASAEASSTSPDAAARLTAEQKKARKELLAKFDTDKNGKLSAQEIIKMTPEDAKKWDELNSARAAQTAKETKPAQQPEAN
jgi:hypothetical protein